MADINNDLPTPPSASAPRSTTSERLPRRDVPSSSPLAAARTQAAGNGGDGKRGFAMPKFGNLFAGMSSKLPKDWYYWVAGIGVLIAGFYYLQAFGMPNFTAESGKTLHFPGAPGLKLAITLASVALLVDCLLGLVEAQDRNDPGWLDWWIPYVAVGTLVFGQLNWKLIMTKPWPWSIGWGLAAGAALTTLLFATLWNPSDQDDPDLLDRFDTTAVFRTMFILGLLHFAKWKSLPYPAFVPLVVVLLIGTLAIFKEAMRTPKFGLFVIALGAAAAVMNSPWWISGTFAAAVVMANVATRQGWIPEGGQRRTETETRVLGRKIKLLKAWDVVILWWATFVITSFVLYGNYALFTIGGG